MDILKEQIEALLTKACPSFVDSQGFREWKEDWIEEAEPAYYLLASSFVRYLTYLNSVKQYDEFPAVFALIEELHLRGDRYVNEWVTVGILEDLQNTSLHPTGSGPDDFVEYLGPVSTWWWEELNLFWSGQIKPPVGSSRRPHPPEMGNSRRSIVDQ